MSSYINGGVQIKCSFGTTPGTLQVLPTGRVQLDGAPVATIMDNIPLTNIMPCGMCQSLANPTVASATSAAFGVLTPMPCIPNTTTPWMGGKTDVLLGGKPTLLSGSKLMCMYGGKIEIMSTKKTSASVGAASVAAAALLCPLCGKDRSEHPFKSIKGGTNHGSSTLLGNRLLKGDRKNHKFAINDENFKAGGYGIEAHHLICSQAINTDEWFDLCIISGYDINKKENGVFLPNIMISACHLHIPLHESNHAASFGSGSKRYPQSVKELIDLILEKYEKMPCEKKNLEQLINDLDAKSKEILGYINRFVWQLTHDGIHYQRGNPVGCSNGSEFKDKYKQRINSKKQHNSNPDLKKITIAGMEKFRSVRNIGYNLMEHCSCNRYHKELRGKSIKNILIIGE